MFFMLPLKVHMLWEMVCVEYFKMGNQFCRIINFEEVASEGERSKKFVHSEDFKASSEKTNVNGSGTSFIDSTVVDHCFYIEN